MTTTETWAVDVFVPGRPAPQGSKQARPVYRGRGAGREFTGRVAQVESSAAVKPWRADIREHLAAHRTGEPLSGPVIVSLEFVMARPKSHYRSGRNASLLRGQAPVRPSGKPDIDKLARAVLDAVTSAGVWKDDSQVVDLRSVKRWADWVDLHETSGCHIRISEETEQ